MLTTTSRSLGVRPHTLQATQKAAQKVTLPTLASELPEDPDKEGWDELIRPEPGEEREVEIGRRVGAPTDRTIAQSRHRLGSMTFHPLDPYVATVAGGVSAGQIKVPGGGESKVRFFSQTLL